MNKATFFRDCFLRSAERLFDASAECGAMVIRLANEKKRYVSGRVIGKLYDREDLVQEDDLDYKKYRSGKYKAIAISVDTEDDIAWLITRSGTLARLRIYFMQDPDEHLNGSKKLTDKERRLLKDMKKLYSVKNTSSELQKLEDMNYELKCLKNGISILYEAYWSYDFEKITSDDFITKGLKANRTIL